MKRALVYFPAFSPNVGGSEFLAFTIIQELHKRYAVTLALSRPSLLPAEASKNYDVSIDWTKVTIVELWPRGWLARLDRHLKFVISRQLRKMGKDFDVCISCANPIDFGRPAIHFVYMLDFDRYFLIWDRTGLRPTKIKSVRDHLLAWRDWFAHVIAGTRTPRQIVCDSKEVVLPNSNYAKERIETFYRCKVHDKFYPPTTFVPTSKLIRRNEHDVACMGRISFEKGIFEIIEIVAVTRMKTGKPLRLRIAGEVLNDDYGSRLKDIAVKCPWIVLEGMLTGEEKATYLAQCKYAIHACGIESFGISLTEYLKAGIVPMVPVKGASSETINDSTLAYRTNEEGVALLMELIGNSAFYREKQVKCCERATVFSAHSYWARQKALLQELHVVEATS